MLTISTTVAGWLGWTTKPSTILTFLAVGQGDCVVLNSGGRTVLIDAGPSERAGEKIIGPALRRRGVDRIDLVVLTHPDRDHLGGLSALLRAYPETRICTSAEFINNDQWREELTRLGIAGDRVAWLPATAQLRVGELQVRLTSPPVTTDDNSASVLAEVKLGNACALLTGDAPTEVERNLARDGVCEAQVLKAGHHGSATSTSTDLLQAARAEWLVISCGRANAYGHPAPAVLERAAAAQVRVARTDLEGDIEFEIRDNRFVRTR